MIKGTAVKRVLGLAMTLIMAPVLALAQAKLTPTQTAMEFYRALREKRYADGFKLRSEACVGFGDDSYYGSGVSISAGKANSDPNRDGVLSRAPRKAIRRWVQTQIGSVCWVWR